MTKLLSSLFTVTSTVLVSILFVSTVSAGPVLLASHRAVYDLTVKDIKRDGGVDDVRGRIVMEVENQCEGYILNQRMLVEMTNVDGGVITSDFHLSTFEDKAGEKMRFSVSNILNGRPVEKYDGVASMKKNGGKVTFQNDKAEDLLLPKGVLFPTGHTLKILQSAQDGKNLVSAKIFDGNGEEGLQDSLTVIGKRGAPSEGMAKYPELSKMPYWPVQLSYFDLREQTNEPNYEVGLKMYENGVAYDLTLKYKDFSLKGSLVQLDFLGMPNCS